MATYTGPTVSPVFVTGVFNDSWEQADSLTTELRNRLAGIEPPPIDGDAAPPLEVSIEATADVPPLGPVPVDADEALADGLTDLLRNFINANYPPIELPDAPEVWQRIAAMFDGDWLRVALLRLRGRHDTVAEVHGWSQPAEERESLLRLHDREAQRLNAGSALNQDILWKTHRKSVQLTQWEVMLKAQLDALEAAKAFLLGCILAVQGKAAEEQRAIARAKQELQATFWRLIEARLAANQLDLERAALEKQVDLDATLSGKDRAAFIQRALVGAAVDEAQAVASQASALINRIGASAGVGASETTP